MKKSPTDILRTDN